MSAIARARALDADGRHDEAINELASAAQRGDAEAMTQLAKRPAKRELLPGVLERGTFEEQANRQVSAQRDRNVACRDAVWTFLDLMHDARPSA